MRADVDAIELDMLLEDYLESLEARKDLPPAIPGRLRAGPGSDLLTAWVVSPEGRRRIAAMLAALRSERRALKALAAFAELQAATAPVPPARPPEGQPARRLTTGGFEPTPAPAVAGPGSPDRGGPAR